MKQQSWWSPDDRAGVLLSHRWVQAFVFEFPPLKKAELETSLRYKVQATLPVSAEGLAFHTQIFRHGKKTCGAAFLASDTAKDALAAPGKALRVGVPLLLPKAMPQNAIMFVSGPDGLAGHYYEEGLLKTSFAPIEPKDMKLRARIMDKCPGADLCALSPDPGFPLPSDLQGKEPTGALRNKLLESFPLWDPPRQRRLPQAAGLFLLLAGLTLCVLAMWTSWSVRLSRNEAWKTWLKKAEAVEVAPSIQEQTALLLKLQGVPVPELFMHLADAWGTETHIVSLEWSQGKLSLTAASASALSSLRKLTADPWFKNIRVDDIRTQKDGSEVFTIEGSLAIDS